MTEKQKNQIKSNKVISFNSLIGNEILDPFGYDEEVYYQVALDIQKGIDILINKINMWR